MASRQVDGAAAWVDDGTWRRRAYASVEQYQAHQRSKLDAMPGFVADVDAQVEAVLAERLPAGVAGASVLCLGARLGGEVRAFRAAGAFAVGVDLNPGAGNRWVLPGDFHALDFAGASVDVVFTNALDHALDLPKVAAEVARVVKPGGVVVAEVGLGTAEGGVFGEWEAVEWRRVDDVVAVFAAVGFGEDGGRVRFDAPWPGEQVRMRAG